MERRPVQRAYSSPRLKLHGGLRELTAGGNDGPPTDLFSTGSVNVT